MNKMLVTTYINPDMDGVASVLSLAYILNKSGQSVEPLLYGDPQPSVKYLIDKLGYKLPFGSIDDNNRWEQYAIVDTSVSKRLPKFIDAQNVIEIIDHHPSESGLDFPNAKIQNEVMGAAATLIWERSNKMGIKLPEDLAKLIYLAIFDNTAFLLANVTLRDEKAIADIKSAFGFTERLTEELIEYDMAYKSTNFDKVLIDDLKEIDLAEGKCIAGQIIFPWKKGNFDLKERIESLAQNLHQKNNSKVLMGIVDPYERTTSIYSTDELLQSKLVREFGEEFEANWMKINTVVLRKKVLIAIATSIR